ncbi:MAG: DUF4179 domain-containing protein [Bacillota bacterium]
MNNHIKSELEKIDIPAELHNRVKMGVNQAKEEMLVEQNRTPSKRPSKRKRWKVGGLVAASILTITLSSGFVHPSMNQVLASTPLLGGIYEKFGDKMGMHLAEQNLVTPLTQEVTKNGVTVKLTNVYFDGDVVSITGNISGDLSKGHNEPGEVSMDLNFENNKGDNDPWLRGMSTDMQAGDNGHDFQWKINYPYKSIKENFTLPISIHYINGIEGEWTFNVPLTQENSKALVLDHSQHYEDDGVTLKVTELKQSKASSTLTFETITSFERDYIELYKAEDENGKLLFQYENDTLLASSKEADGYHQTFRKTVDQIAAGTKAITFYPAFTIADPTVQQRLDETSFTLESERSDLAIKVNNVTQEGDKLILDYQFQGLANDLSNHKLEIIHHNLSYAFTLVDQDFVDKIDPENPFPPEGHSISRNEVKVINQKNHKYQAVFDLKGEEKFENFSLADTVLRMDFNSYIDNKELAPFTVELPRQK